MNYCKKVSSNPIFILRVITALAALVGLVLSFFYGVNTDQPPLPRIIRFLSLFTIQNNLIIFLAIVIPLLAPASTVGNFFLRAPVRTCMAAYIIIVGVVYHFVIAPTWNPTGPTKLAMVLHHYATPVLFFIDWILFIREKDRRGLSWITCLVTFAYPIAYIAWTLIHGSWSGWYPYPFLEVPEVGYAGALAACGGLLIQLLILQSILVALGRALAKDKPDLRPPQAEPLD